MVTRVVYMYIVSERLEARQKLCVRCVRQCLTEYNSAVDMIYTHVHRSGQLKEVVLVL